MGELISRAAAIEYLMTNMSWHDEDGYEVDDADEKQAIITDLVNGIPAVDAKPVVHGRWVVNKYGDIVCSKCGACAMMVMTGCIVNRHYEYYKSVFCHDCGAKMDGERRAGNGTDT